MKKLYTVANQWSGLFLLTVGMLVGQSVRGQAIPDVQWTQPGGGPIAVLSDGNLVAGAGESLLKYDAQGNEIGRVELFNPPAAPFRFAPRAVQLSGLTDGGIAAVLEGRAFDTGPTIFVVRTYNGAGVLLGTASEFVPNTTAYTDIMGTPDGGFLLLSLTGAPSGVTTVRKYTRDAQLLWSQTVAYPNANPGQLNPSATRGAAVVNAPDGGYVVAGSYTADPVNSPDATTGWVAKLGPQGTVIWQTILGSFPLPAGDLSDVGLAVHSTFAITDIIRAADGNGYALTGSGAGFSSRVLAPARTVLIEITPEGNFRRSRLTDVMPTPAYIALYTGNDGALHYAIGNSAETVLGADYQVLKIRANLTAGNSPSLLPIVAQRIFITPQVDQLRGFAVMGDGGLVLSGTGGLRKLFSERPASGLLVGTPAYNCQTGELVATASAATGAPVEYQIRGLRGWSTSNVFQVPTYQRLGTTFTIEVRQNGQIASLLFTTDCLSVPPDGRFALRLPDFNCQTGELTLFYSNGDGSAVDYRVAGLRDWGASATFAVPNHQRIGTTFTLQARTASGKTDELLFTTSCTSNPPPTNLPAGFGVPDLDCTNGRLIVTTAGGNNTPFEFKVPGLRDWGPSALFMVPNYQRTGTTFTLFLRQSGREFTSQFTTGCPAATRLATPEVSTRLRAVIYPNPVGEQFTVEVRGATRQPVQFQVVDLHGHLLQSRQVEVSGDRHQERFTLPTSSAGLYLLRVATPEQRVTVKVLKQY